MKCNPTIQITAAEAQALAALDERKAHPVAIMLRAEAQSTAEKHRACECCEHHGVEHSIGKAIEHAAIHA